MTMAPYGCDTFALHLGDYLEGDADAVVRAAMDDHAVACADCRTLLADVERIRSDAAALPTLAPQRDLWSGVAERIGTPVLALPARRAGGMPRWMRPAAAAAALVVVTAGVTYVATRSVMRNGAATAVAGGTATRDARGGGFLDRGRPSDEPTLPGGSPTAVATADGRRGRGESNGDSTGESTGKSTGVSPRDATSSRRPGTAASSAGAPPHRGGGGAAGGPSAILATYRPGELASLDSLYYREIVRLHEVLGQRRAVLDSGTVAVLDRNMRLIDRAIAECRAALAADPASHFLNEQLNQALESKIELLRTTAMMPIGS